MNVIVGPGDDAGVIMLGEDNIIVQTVDIITPLVDDPFTFGAISAVNSLSDIYAMGGKPLSALIILGYDPCEFNLKIIKEILGGAISILKKTGTVLLGGHTVNDPELKFGLSVTGTVKRKDVLKNRGASPGELIVLTKPLGTGIATTAHKAQKLKDEYLKETVSWMLTLNDMASSIALKAGASSATDVTGFGLLGHAMNMVKNSGMDFYLEFSRIPVMNFIKELLESGMIPKGAYDNLNFVRNVIDVSNGIKEDDLLILCDPQTSGGLLFTVREENIDIIKDSGIFFSVIGRTGKGSGVIHIGR